MRHRLCLVAMMTFFSLTAALSANSQELLDSKSLNDSLYLSISGTTLKYSTKPDGTYIDLPDQTTFVARLVTVRFREFNPFKYTVTVNATASDDPVYKSIGDFLTALRGFGTTLELIPSSGADSAPMSTINTAAAAYISKAGPPGTPECSADTAFMSALQKVVDDVAAPAVDMSSLDTVTDSAVSRDKIRAAADKLTEFSKSVQQHIKEMDQHLAELAKYVKTNCLPSADIVNKMLIVSSQYSKRVEKNKAVSASLDAVTKSLRDFVNDSSKWSVVKDVTYYEVKAQALERGKQYSLAISVVLRDTKVSDEGLQFATTSEIKRTVTIRRHFGWVPEVAGGVAWNQIKYPKWGTKEEGGVTKVESAGDETQKALPVLFLNWICRCGGDNPLYPMAQIGLGIKKDRPAVLTGAGIRFTYPENLSLSAGAVVTWFKDLKTLKEGDTVSGTADLEKDMDYKRSPIELYIALQYKF